MTTAVAEREAQAQAPRDLSTLEEIDEALGELGYATKLQEHSVSVNAGHDVVATVMIDQDKNEVVFNCLIASLGELIGDIQKDEANAGKAFNILLAMLEQNTYIRPFAYSQVPNEEKMEESPVFLIDSVPLGDFSTEELKKTMDNLNRALSSARKLVQAFS